MAPDRRRFRAGLRNSRRGACPRRSRPAPGSDPEHFFGSSRWIRRCGPGSSPRAVTRLGFGGLCPASAAASCPPSLAAEIRDRGYTRRAATLAHPASSVRSVRSPATIRGSAAGRCYAGSGADERTVCSASGLKRRAGHPHRGRNRVRGLRMGRGPRRGRHQRPRRAGRRVYVGAAAGHGVAASGGGLALRRTQRRSGVGCTGNRSTGSAASLPAVLGRELSSWAIPKMAHSRRVRAVWGPPNRSSPATPSVRGAVQRQVTSVRGVVRRGNSGGPAVNSEGRVVATIFGEGIGWGDVGYGVPSSIVQEAVAETQRREALATNPVQHSP
jgi:hypothetical protein